MKTLHELCESNLSEFVDRALVNIEQFNSVEQATQYFAQYIYDECSVDSRSELVLSRIFHSFEFGALPQDIKAVAYKKFGDNIPDTNLFLNLIGTYGQESEWQQRTRSSGHQVIPLTRESISLIPMVSRLFQQIGFDLGVLLKEEQASMNMDGVAGAYGMFYVDQAQGSAYIPAQDFVSKYGVKSVIGTGVMLPTGNISVFIGFCRVVLGEKVAAGISPLMSLFWQKAFPLITKGYFSSY